MQSEEEKEVSKRRKNKYNVESNFTIGSLLIHDQWEVTAVWLIVLSFLLMISWRHFYKPSIIHPSWISRWLGISEKRHTNLSSSLPISFCTDFTWPGSPSLGILQTAILTLLWCKQLPHWRVAQGLPCQKKCCAPSSSLIDLGTHTHTHGDRHTHSLTPNHKRVLWPRGLEQAGKGSNSLCSFRMERWLRCHAGLNDFSFGSSLFLWNNFLKRGVYNWQRLFFKGSGHERNLAFPQYIYLLNLLMAHLITG